MKKLLKRMVLANKDEYKPSKNDPLLKWRDTKKGFKSEIKLAKTGKKAIAYLFGLDGWYIED